jgi:predicted GIY-YIG superfamily endonuclease
MVNSEGACIGENMQNSQLINELRTDLVPMPDVWSYQPTDTNPEWYGRYQQVRSGKQTYARPDRNESSFALKLREDNPLGLNKHSAGIYVIYDTESCIYIGKTDTKISQRFHAHITKLTATNNKRHHHPEKWQAYAKWRAKNKTGALHSLDDFNIGFYDFSNFRKFLDGETNNASMDDMEALIFYGLSIANDKDRLLNVEHQVGNQKAREKWRQFFAN